MSFTLNRSAAGLALLTALLAGCGASTGSSPPGGQSSTPAASTPAATTPAATTPAATPSPTTTKSSGIPQGNGGDQDADNNGGPSDGDGNI
ncbi:MAG TPA: hypothetical protein VKD26_04390 [Streptosporangiaceae bacterium]|nr:hypothetical protein [Streptosporangiaceae bacterium]